MITSKTISEIKDDECEGGKPDLKPYRCTANKLSIGFGRNLEDRGITKDEAEYLFRNDTVIAEKDARALFVTFDELNDARQSVLINMSFNLGYARLAKFKRFIAAMNRGDYSLAADEMLESKWAKVDVPNRAKRLANRMRRGEW